MLKRFNTSNSRDYDYDNAHPDGTLIWNSEQGLRLHDGETPGGDPIIGIHNWTDYIATAVGQDGPNTIVFANDLTNMWELSPGNKFYLVGDNTETQYTISSRTYDSGGNVTFVVATSNFNYTPILGTIVYRTILKDSVNQLKAGDGIELEQTGQKLVVQKQYSGQYTLTMNAGNVFGVSNIDLENLQSCLMVAQNENGYVAQTPGEIHSLTLPFDYAYNPDFRPSPAIPLGTRVTIMNLSGDLTLSVTGWPAPGYDLLPYQAMELVYYNDSTDGGYGGNLWWVVNTWSW